MITGVGLEICVLSHTRCCVGDFFIRLLCSWVVRVDLTEWLMVSVRRFRIVGGDIR